MTTSGQLRYEVCELVQDKDIVRTHSVHVSASESYTGWLLSDGSFIILHEDHRRVIDYKLHTEGCCMFAKLNSLVEATPDLFDLSDVA